MVRVMVRVMLRVRVMVMVMVRDRVRARVTVTVTVTVRLAVERQHGACRRVGPTPLAALGRTRPHRHAQEAPTSRPW